MISKNQLEYFKQSTNDVLLLNALYLELDAYQDLKEQFNSLKDERDCLEYELELMHEAYDGSLDYISSLKSANIELELELELKDNIILDHEEFLASIDDYN